MPIHDWTRVRANRFHHFHQTWTPLIAAALNGGLLPAGYFAMAEQITGGPEPDVITLSLPIKAGGHGPAGIGILLVVGLLSFTLGVRILARRAF